MPDDTKPISTSDIAKQLTAMLKQAAQEEGISLKADLQAAELYLIGSARRLAVEVSEAGYQEGLIAERDACALEYAGAAVTQADQIDNRILGIIEAGLGILSRVAVPA